MHGGPEGSRPVNPSSERILNQSIRPSLSRKRVSARAPASPRATPISVRAIPFPNIILLVSLAFAPIAIRIPNS